MKGKLVKLIKKKIPGIKKFRTPPSQRVQEQLEKERIKEEKEFEKERLREERERLKAEKMGKKPPSQPDQNKRPSEED